ncbi:MAG: hypothetical protein E7668_04240 [Ruminococcaceae bacterium]|nr:hypothetical protein [Oscillospiraceae bacterium]
MKEKTKITFWQLLLIWFCIALPLAVLNGFFLKIPFAHNIILSTLGIILLIYPIYPIELTSKFTEKQCRIFIRTLAGIEILLSLATIIVF